MSDPISPPSPFREFWKYFSSSKGALFSLFVVIFFVLVALFADLIAPYEQNRLFDSPISPPFWDGGKFLLGTDEIGRDMLSRLVHGARVSMGIGFLVVLFSMSVGTILGLVSGYFGGLVDKTIMRLVDILMALPSILLAIVVVSILGPSLLNTIVAVSFVALPGFIRLARAGAMTEKKKKYVIASKTYGTPDIRIIFSNILPNCTAPLIVQGALGFSDGILNAAALGFLGLGAQPPIAEWGTMLSDSRPYIESAPHLVTLPGLCILIVVLAFNLLGDGLRDALDPRLKK